MAVDILETDNTMRPEQNGRHFADDIFKYILLKENIFSFQFN